MLKTSEVSSVVQNFIDDLKESLRANTDKISPKVMNTISQIIDNLSVKGNYVSLMPEQALQRDDLSVLAEGALEMEQSIKNILKEIEETPDESKKQELNQELIKDRKTYLNLIERAKGRRGHDHDRFQKFISILMSKRKQKGWA